VTIARLEVVGCLDAAKRKPIDHVALGLEENILCV